MKHLVLTPDRNSPPDNDFTGAFEPESNRYAAYWRAQGDTVTVVRVDVSKRGPERVTQSLAAINAAAPIDRFALFAHGWRTGVQIGLSTATPRDEERLVTFANELARCSTPALKVALYCCSTGSSNGPVGDGGDTGFADLLRDALLAAGRTEVSVFAHTSAGHTTRNANVRYFFSDTTSGGIDLAKHSTPEGRILRARLADGKDALRWRLPWLTLAEARAELVRP